MWIYECMNIWMDIWMYIWMALKELMRKKYLKESL